MNDGEIVRRTPAVAPPGPARGLLCEPVVEAPVVPAVVASGGFSLCLGQQRTHFERTRGTHTERGRADA